MGKMLSVKRNAIVVDIYSSNIQCVIDCCQAVIDLYTKVSQNISESVVLTEDSSSTFKFLPYNQFPVICFRLNAAETWIDTSSSASQKGFFRSVIDKVRHSGIIQERLFLQYACWSIQVMSNENVPHFDAHFMSETGVVDIFLFGGPSPRDVQRQLSKTTGVC